MTAAKDMSRPASQQHRLSVGSNASSLPRNSYARSHSHTASLGSVNPTNRINRRKSSTFSKPSSISAAVENAVADGSIAVKRRGSVSKSALASLSDAPHNALPSSLPYHASVPEHGSAVVDGPALATISASEKSKPKNRRASDGAHLSRKEKAAAGELKCEHCGKAYKHGSCLTKHLWEHTPQWQYTSKLLISKHQQVQLLEAASVLMAITQDGTNDSDNSSSPAASGSSDMHDDDVSSAETTPPPQSETHMDSKRFSNNSSVLSRSYQSVFSTGSVPGHDDGFSHHRQWSASSNSRPMTANTSLGESYRGDEDPQDLAAAVGLLSCSYGTPKHGPTGLPLDVPPVPPLPAKYQNYRTPSDVEMDDDDESDDDAQTGNDDMEDHGMFGKMDA